MEQDGLDRYSMIQLVDLLAKSTKELLTLMNNKRVNGDLLHDKRKQVHLIQNAIDRKRSSDIRK